MIRRAFITLLGGAAAWPLAAPAQQAAMPVIGFLGARSANSDAGYVAAFRQGLSENGFVAGQNVQIEFRWADGQSNRLPALAADLVRRRVTVIVTAGAPAAPVAKAATATIPIIFSTGSDPVKVGLVASLNRPGGNLTGVTTLARELGAKRLGLLRDLLPQVGTIAYLVNPDEQDTADTQTPDIQEAARGIGRQLVVLSVRTERDIEAAFASIVQRGIGALLVGSSPSTTTWRGLVVALAARHGIPALYPIRESAALGGLISYGTSFTAAYHQVGVYAGRVLKGAKPADMPVVQPEKFELVINLITARALGLTIPSGILAIADEVIE